MNYHKPTGTRLLFAICIFASLSLKAQQKAPIREPDTSKPRLFNSLPASVEVESQDLLNILNPEIQKTGEIKLPLAEGRISAFTGRMVHEISEDQQHTVTIQSTNFHGAVLTLSSVTKADGTVNFIGRIFSYQHSDALELQQKGKRLYWVKKNLHEMMAE